MAYETGGSSSITDLLDKIRVFALAQGWTVEHFAARTDKQGNPAAGAVANSASPSTGADVPGQSLLIAKAGARFAFHTDTRTNSLTGSDTGPHLITQIRDGAYSAGQASTGQTGSSAGAVTNKLAGPFQAYHLFAGSNYLHAVVEIVPGEFRHFGVGTLNKAGAVTSGQYAFGTMWSQNSSLGYRSNAYSSQHGMPFDDSGLGLSGGAASYYVTHVRVDTDGKSPRYAYLDGYSGDVATDPYRNGYGGYIRTGIGRTAGAALAVALTEIGPSTLTGRTVLVPLVVGVARPSGFFSLAGAAPDMRSVRLDNLAPGDVVALGPGSWKVFPISRKNGAAGQENSAALGLAYRVV